MIKNTISELDIGHSCLIKRHVLAKININTAKGTTIKQNIGPCRFGEIRWCIGPVLENAVFETRIPDLSLCEFPRMMST